LIDERSTSKTLVVGGRRYWCHGSQTSAGSVQPAASGGAACGVERWQVKTLTYAGARSIRFRARSPTIAALRRLRPPDELGTRRIGPRGYSGGLSQEFDRALDVVAAVVEVG
jgi:hypothetical protein